MAGSAHGFRSGRLNDVPIGRGVPDAHPTRHRPDFRLSFKKSLKLTLLLLREGRAINNDFVLRRFNKLTLGHNGTMLPR